MSASDSRTEMMRLLADAKQQVDSTSQTMSALKAQREAFVQKWHSDVGAQLVTDSNDLDATRQLAQKAQKLRDLVSLDSPEDAIVVKVGKLSPGSVYNGGGTDATSPGTDPLFTLMPVNAPLFADLAIPVYRHRIRPRWACSTHEARCLSLPGIWRRQGRREEHQREFLHLG